MINVALLAMVNVSRHTSENDTSDECPDNSGNTNNTPHLEKEGEFHWDGGQQAALLSAFYYGYTITQFPGGFAAEKFGIKKVFGFAVIGPSFLALLLPSVARWNVYALIAALAILGLISSPLYPCAYAIWGLWSPQYERSRILALTGSAFFVGTVVGETATGALCASDFLGGWPSPFYVFGAIGLSLGGLWILLAHDTPRDHPRISDDELILIESSLGPAVKYENPPWKKLLTCIPLWSVLITLFTYGIACTAILNDMPSYMKQILRFNVVESGFLSSAPYLTAVPLALLSGVLADYLIKHEYLSVTVTRKLFTLIGQLSMAALLLGMALVGCDKVATLALYFIAISALSLPNVGFLAAILDFAPRYAGTLTGIINTTYAAGGIIGPLLVGVFTKGAPSLFKWRNVFYFNASMFVVGSIVFCLFGSAEEQDWAKRQEPLPYDQFKNLDDTRSQEGQPHQNSIN